MKVVKYWRTEPLDKDCPYFWSGYHESEEAAIEYVLKYISEYNVTNQLYVCGYDFEILPYYSVNLKY